MRQAMFYLNCFGVGCGLAVTVWALTQPLGYYVAVVNLCGALINGLAVLGRLTGGSRG